MSMFWTVGITDVCVLMLVSYKHVLDGLYRVVREEGPFKAFNGATMASSRAVLVTIGQVRQSTSASLLSLKSPCSCQSGGGDCKSLLFLYSCQCMKTHNLSWLLIDHGVLVEEYFQPKE